MGIAIKKEISTLSSRAGTQISATMTKDATGTERTAESSGREQGGCPREAGAKRRQQRAHGGGSDEAEQDASQRKQYRTPELRRRQQQQ